MRNADTQSNQVEMLRLEIPGVSTKQFDFRTEQTGIRQEFEHAQRFPVGTTPLTPVLPRLPVPEPCALNMFRHQSNFHSAPQSVSSNFLETD